MSLYNMINGVNKAVLLFLPMLGKHPDEYPRFRDCFIKDDEHPEYDNHIHIYTRVGGGNRGQGYGEEKLFKHPNFVTTFDDDYDNTYGTYVFSVPEKWKADFDKIIEGKGLDVSDEYKAEMIRVFPKLEDRINDIFKDVK